MGCGHARTSVVGGCVAGIVRMGELAPSRSGSGDADIVWASNIQHTVEGMNGHLHLSRPTPLVRARSPSPITCLNLVWELGSQAESIVDHLPSRVSLFGLKRAVSSCVDVCGHRVIAAWRRKLS